jgi:hypothetical protein
LPWGTLGVSAGLLNLLVDRGTCVTQLDEFGEMHVGIVSSSCVFQSNFRAKPDTIGALCLPLDPCDFAGAHKLRLVLELHRQGWVGQHIADDLLADSPHTFSLSMVSGSSLYFRALLGCSHLFARGLRSILCSRPHCYYRCLLELPDLSPLIAFDDADLCSMTNANFMTLLQGQVPDLNDAALALEDAPADFSALDDVGVPDGPPPAPPLAHEVVGPIAAGIDVFDELLTAPVHANIVHGLIVPQCWVLTCMAQQVATVLHHPCIAATAAGQGSRRTFAI